MGHTVLVIGFFPLFYNRTDHAIIRCLCYVAATYEIIILTQEIGKAKEISKMKRNEFLSIGQVP